MKLSPIAVVLRGSFAACVLGACAVAAGPAVAGPLAATGPAASPRATHAPARKHAARAHPSTVRRALGMRAIVDPATGRLASSPRVSDAAGAPSAAPAAAPRSPAAAPVVRTLADGTQIVTVPADQMQYEVARVGKDGKLVRACVHGDPGAASFPAQREDR